MCAARHCSIGRLGIVARIPPTEKLDTFFFQSSHPDDKLEEVPTKEELEGEEGIVGSWFSPSALWLSRPHCG